jgi:hypothetical protein
MKETTLPDKTSGAYHALSMTSSEYLIAIVTRYNAQYCSSTIACSAFLVDIFHSFAFVAIRFDMLVIFLAGSRAFSAYNFDSSSITRRTCL